MASSPITDALMQRQEITPSAVEGLRGAQLSRDNPSKNLAQLMYQLHGGRAVVMQNAPRAVPYIDNWSNEINTAKPGAGVDPSVALPAIQSWLQAHPPKPGGKVPTDVGMKPPIDASGNPSSWADIDFGE